jgi:hypothetical protein
MVARSKNNRNEEKRTEPFRREGRRSWRRLRRHGSPAPPHFVANPVARSSLHAQHRDVPPRLKWTRCHRRCISSRHCRLPRRRRRRVALGLSSCFSLACFSSAPMWSVFSSGPSETGKGQEGAGFRTYLISPKTFFWHGLFFNQA